jgi:IS1 family transposase
MLDHMTILLVTMNVLPQAKQAAILKALTEGSSIRSTARMVGVSKTTVLRLLVEVGELCAIYQDHKLRNLLCRSIQADEIWAFVGAKQRHAKRPGDGDIWTFTAIDADTKLVVTWLVGQRSGENAHSFMHDLHSRLANRVQLTTDAFTPYISAVEGAFGWQGVDFSQLVKHYTGDPTGRYSPPICTGVTRHPVMGHSDPTRVSTSFVERQNLHLRMNARRFTRLTNAFSKKVANHAHAVALHFMVYNFCRPHGTLTKAAKGIHTTPAMAAGVADHVWTVEELVGLLDPEHIIE